MDLILEKNEKKTKYPFFAASYSTDADNVMQSSSGGMFYELCKAVIGRQGVVYGAAFKEAAKAEHRRAATLAEASKFRGSKYMRSELNGCFLDVKEDLQQGKTVLFSGVGCQIAGLYRYLGRKQEGLLTCEVVCHGAPLAEALEMYIAEKESKLDDKITRINFRDKRKGWKDNCLTEYFMSGQEDTCLSREHPVHSLYLQGINMEEPCAECPCARLPRTADMTLADFWEYKGSLSKQGERSGMSLVAVNTPAGERLFDSLQGQICYEMVTGEEALSSCRHMDHAPFGHPSRKAFRYLIKNHTFHAAYDLCGTFGEVVLAEELIITPDLTKENARAVFLQDTQALIYMTDEEEHLTGIVTFGAFVKGYGNRTQWFNTAFSSVVFSEGCKEELSDIFRNNKKINRIPVTDNEGRILFEVRRDLGANGKKDARKHLLTFARLSYLHNTCFYVKRPDMLADYSYSEKQERRMEKEVSFPVMQAAIETYGEDFKEILGEHFTADYVKELCKIPPIIQRGDRYRHADGRSGLVNVLNGCRVTVGQPEKYELTLHVYGRCGAFGYAVEDKDTLPSALQALCNGHHRKIRVMNHGLWGADDEKVLLDLKTDMEEGVIEPKDIVLIYMAYLPWMEELKELSVRVLDTTLPFHDHLKRGGTFFDKPGHMTAEGYSFIAQYVFDRLDLNKVPDQKYADIDQNGEKLCVKKTSGEFSERIKEYLEDIKPRLPMERMSREKVGAIVMNCNPFTRGHRFLIEEAMKKTDILILFVVEEDHSYFPFVDRLHMVKLGTQDLDNVFVLPSGSFMISALTFPEYFLKEQKPDAIISAAADVEIFGKYIAPALHISVRFVGTEPRDKVTDQYNDALKAILPDYGLQLCEIPRLTYDKGVVTATEVRGLLKLDDKDAIHKLIPDTTFDYLAGAGIIKE